DQLVLSTDQQGKGSASREAHGQSVHRQSVVEEVVQFAEPPFLSHLLELPNRQPTVPGLEAGIIVVIRFHSFLDRRSRHKEPPNVIRTALPLPITGIEKTQQARGSVITPGEQDMVHAM